MHKAIAPLFLSLSSIFASASYANTSYNCHPQDTVAQTGKASYYGNPFHGRKTASGETFNMHAMTAASNTFKMGTLLEVTNNNNGKTVIVRINDTGGFAKYNRVLDLSQGAAEQIDMIQAGVVPVTIRRCTPNS